MVINERQYVKFLLDLGVKYYPCHTCKCGCNGLIEVKKGHYSNSLPNYIHGHYNRNRIMPTEQRKKLSISRIGRKCSEETRQKIREHHLGKKRPNHSKIMKGRKHSQETKQKLREQRLGEKNPFFGKKHSEEFIKNIRDRTLGKTYEELYGEEKTREFKIILSERQLGEKHWNWQGGLSKEEYCDAWNDKEYKDDLKEENCQNPFCRNISEKLCLHHINYNKQFCSPINLITICFSCNAMANFNRDLWQFIYSWIKISKEYDIEIILPEKFEELLEVYKDVTI